MRGHLPLSWRLTMSGRLPSHPHVRDVIFQISFPFGHETMLAVKALQVGLCTEPDAVCRPACLALSDRLRQQAVTQSAPPATWER